MLETTRRDVLDPDSGLDGGGLLVLLSLSAGQPEPHPWLHVKPGAEVHFGRSVAEDLGVLDALRDAPQDPTLSRRHARLALDDGGAYLVDLGSTNGTWLNGRRLECHVPTRVPSGAVFHVGASRFAWLDVEPPVTTGESGLGWLEREAFERACLTALMRCQRYERPLALIVLSEGDDPADSEGVDGSEPVWLGCVSPEHVLGSLGPGEWGLLLPEHTLPGAHDVADFILATTHRWRSLTGEHVTGQELRVGVTAVEHDAPASKGRGRGDVGLALDLDSVRLLLAAAREDRDATAGWVEPDAVSAGGAA